MYSNHIYVCVHGMYTGGAEKPQLLPSGAGVGRLRDRATGQVCASDEKGYLRLESRTYVRPRAGHDKGIALSSGVG